MKSKESDVEIKQPAKACSTRPNNGLVVCLSCVKSKRSKPSKARDMYVSALFTKMLAYAESLHPEKIYILSAKYGLLNLDDEIDPYELTLKNMPARARSLWAESVLSKMKREVDLENNQFVFLAGMPYRENLLQHIRHYTVPMEGLSFGRQLQWLDGQLRS